MLLNKLHFNVKSNNYSESLDNLESPTKSLNIMSQRTLAIQTGNGKVKIK